MALLMVSPDLTGFRDAMGVMRQEMGNDVPFYTPIAGTYPAGTALDPETGKPFDPTIAAEDSGEDTTVLRVGVYTATVPNDRSDNVVANAVGWFEEGNIILDMDPADYATVTEATQVSWDGGRYEIEDVDGSKINDVEHRKLVYARKT